MWLSCVLGVVWLSVRLSERLDRPGGWWLVGLRATVLRVWLRVLLAGVGLSVWLIVRLRARVAAA